LKDGWAIGVRFHLKSRKRDLAVFDFAIDSKLRGCDLVRLQVNDVCAGNRVRDRGTLVQKKTEQPASGQCPMMVPRVEMARDKSMRFRNLPCGVDAAKGEAGNARVKDVPVGLHMFGALRFGPRRLNL
jgi:hypothetical protein